MSGKRLSEEFKNETVKQVVGSVYRFVISAYWLNGIEGFVLNRKH